MSEDENPPMTLALHIQFPEGGGMGRAVMVVDGSQRYTGPIASELDPCFRIAADFVRLYMNGARVS